MFTLARAFSGVSRNVLDARSSEKLSRALATKNDQSERTEQRANMVSRTNVFLREGRRLHAIPCWVRKHRNCFTRAGICTSARRHRLGSVPRRR